MNKPVATNQLLGIAISVLALFKIIGIFIPLEFNDSIFRENFRLCHALSIIILAFIWILLRIYDGSSTKNVIKFILLSIPISFIFMITSFILYIGPCIWEEGRNEYVQKDGGARIQERMLNCGATTDYSYQHYYVKPVSPFLNFIWQVDTTQINKGNWTRVTPGNLVE